MEEHRGVIDERRAIRHLMDLLAIEGPSGREGAVAAAVREKLRTAGCPAGRIGHDRVHRKVPRDRGELETGNLIVKLPGTVRAPRLLFSAHMDTVPLCRGAVPVRRDDRILPSGRTALGGDNRTAVAALVTLVETLVRARLPHPPLTVLFTVGEESGLLGACLASPADLGRPKLGFNVDGGRPADLVVGAVGAERWEAQVRGRSAHAGVHPEHGISAALIASRAIADVADRGWFGRIVKGSRRGTSNVGTVRGGEANNQVTDHVLVRGESRSHSRSFVGRITRAYRQAFERAARSVKNNRGETGSVDFRARTDYEPFRLARNSPVVRRAERVARSIGLEPVRRVADGGLDANWLNAKGIPTVTLGAGQHAPHTLDEYVDLPEFLDGCRLVVALATAVELAPSPA